MSSELGCPFCGAASRVLEVKEGANGTLRRRRECENEHRFLTYEMHGNAISPNHRSVRRFAASAQRRIALWRRDQQIALAVAAFGWQYAAQKWELSKSSVFLAIKRAKQRAVKKVEVLQHRTPDCELQEDSPGA